MESDVSDRLITVGIMYSDSIEEKRDENDPDNEWNAINEIVDAKIMLDPKDCTKVKHVLGYVIRRQRHKKVVGI